MSTGDVQAHLAEVYARHRVPPAGGRQVNVVMGIKGVPDRAAGVQIQD